VVKGDPHAIPIKIHRIANYFRKPAGVEEEGKIARFEVYLDPTQLVKRMEEISMLMAP
jgi:hypothetical protein